MDKKDDILDTKTEFVETQLDEKENDNEKLSYTNDYKGLNAFGIAVTAIYSLVAFEAIYLLAMYLIDGILESNIKFILIGVVGFVLVALPYLLLFKAGRKKNKKVLNAGVIYELCCLVIVIVFFFFFIMPEMVKIVKNQPCTTVNKDGIIVPCESGGLNK